MSLINKHYKTVKNAIHKYDLADPYFCSKYSFSPYMACSHGCKYCDGRAEKYYVEGNFEEDIIIRKNIPDILDEDLKKLREPGFVFIGSGISDAYQPVEREEKLMHKCAEVLAANNFPVTILTKSSLIERDFAIWEKVHKKNGFLLMMSVNTLNEKIRRIFEPKTSSIKERLGTLRKFKSAGIYTGIACMPLLPFLLDNKDNLYSLFKKCEELDIDFIITAGLTLRSGKQKNLYMKTISEFFPELIMNYKNIYGNEAFSGAPIYQYDKKKYKDYGEILEIYNIPSETPHYIYKKKFSLYDELYILLNHLYQIYERKNKPYKRLRYSINNYKIWLIKEKRYFNRKRSMHYIQLEEKLKHLVKSEKFYTIIKNKKLLEFIKKLIIDRKTFDYKNLIFEGS